MRQASISDSNQDANMPCGQRALNSGSFGGISRSSHVAMVLAVPMILLGIAGSDLASVLEYERSGIIAGEWWRAITSHFVHLDSFHLTGNLIGMLAWGYLFDERESVRAVVLKLLTYALAICAGVLVFNEQIQWILGASGLIHALIAGSALRLAIETRRPLGIVVLSVLLLKVVAEQQLDLASWMESIAEYPIVSVAHVYGVAAGLIFELARRFRFSGRTAFRSIRGWRVH